MTEQKDSRHIFPKDYELPSWADPMPMDWRALPIDEIMHRRIFDETSNH